MASLPANSKDPVTLAVLSNYFFANTVTTVGYGDISPKQPVEMFIIMWLEVIKFWNTSSKKNFLIVFGYYSVSAAPEQLYQNDEE